MKNFLKTALALLGATVLAGQLNAQPAADALKPADVDQRLSAERMKAEATTLRVQVREDLQRAQHLQALARKESDIIKLTCVNDKLVRIKAQANIFDAAHRELMGVVESGSPGAEAFEQVVGSAGEVRRIREEADGCVGQPDLVGDSANEFTGPEVVDDPTLGLPFDVTVEPPAYASPYI